MSAGKPSLMRAFVGGALIVAGGWGIMAATTPNEQQFYDQLSPELKARVDAQRNAARRKAAYAEQAHRAQDQDDSPVQWQTGKEARDSTPPPTGAFGKPSR
ncbi:cargo transport protein erv29 [Ceraceosorus bombacis]|uniref:Cargo transport protein erv29 n=1 Tax=Ceraceosorus bombacis TaxID=401625 RepID=A0A0P1BJ83_9BASI|nr:cargo transport protein erv29 [Ceraceosorus bombacis]